MKEFRMIGKSIPALDARDKATGKAQFLSNMNLSGLLYGKVLRSPLPHAKILRIDTTKAEDHPGVKVVLTAKDSPKIPIGIFRQQANKLPLCDEKVRYIGDEVAAVAADDPYIAEDALDLIDVEYEELPAVFDAEQALKADAPLIHGGSTNVERYICREFGDVEKGFAEADYIVEDRFVTQSAAHCSLEPRGCIADYDASGRLTLWAATQNSHFLREELAQVLNLPISKISVIKTVGGGCFGGRMTMDPVEAICAMLSIKARRPVKIVNTRQEEFSCAHIRYPMVIHLKTGAKKSGRLVARQAKIITDNGAYNYHGSAVTGNACAKISQLYSIPNVKAEGYVVFTNKQYGAPFRGYGNPQINFAMESQLDMLAEKIGMDPKQIRAINANKPGEVTPSGCQITTCGLPECIEEAAKKVNWKKKWGKRNNNRGIGMANVIHAGSGAKYFYGKNCNFSNAIIKFNIDGSVDVLTGECDVGQGSETILAQIVAEELGLRIDDIRMVSGHTDATPVCLGTWGSRVTFIGGNAVKAAAIDAKRQLLPIAAEMLEANVEDLTCEDGMIYIAEAPSRAVSIVEASSKSYRDKGQPIIGKGNFDDPLSTAPDAQGRGNMSSTYSFATQVAEVEVDRETGMVKVTNFVAAHDVGRAINPAMVEGQIEGAVAQGIGFGLTESLIWDDGQIINASFQDYKLLTAKDVSPVTSIIVETDDPGGPFGAKGIGELGLVPTAPAIANAIYDAIGVRIKELPITHEKIWAALRSEELNE